MKYDINTKIDCINVARLCCFQHHTVSAEMSDMTDSSLIPTFAADSDKIGSVSTHQSIYRPTALSPDKIALCKAGLRSVIKVFNAKIKIRIQLRR